jgi:nitrogen fixation NifU-like protein
MTDDMRELYQEMILDHHKKPRNFRTMTGASHHAEGYNPLCGDRVTIYLLLEGDTVRDISFQGSGCAICTASTSVMTEVLKGRTIHEAERLFTRFHDLVAGEADEAPDIEELGKLAVFSGVREFPIRIKCAILPWHTFHAALENRDEMVSTE